VSCATATATVNTPQLQQDGLEKNYGGIMTTLPITRKSWYLLFLDGF
jgi:hypothetical protein